MVGIMPTDPSPDADVPASRSSLARVRMWLWVAIPVLLVAVGIAWLMRPVVVTRGDGREGYSAAFGGSFEMVDQNGQTVTDETLRGRPYAIFFGFTRCPDVCPTTLSRMAQRRQALGNDGDKFDIVFVSVDPEIDTREGIGSYLELFDTPIIGLTGTSDQIDRIVKAFHVYYAKVPTSGGDYTIDHTASVFLMDAEGRFTTTVDHHENSEAAVAKLRRLATRY